MTSTQHDQAIRRSGAYVQIRCHDIPRWSHADQNSPAAQPQRPTGQANHTTPRDSHPPSGIILSLRRSPSRDHGVDNFCFSAGTVVHRGSCRGRRPATAGTDRGVNSRCLCQQLSGGSAAPGHDRTSSLAAGDAGVSTRFRQHLSHAAMPTARPRSGKSEISTLLNRPPAEELAFLALQAPPMKGLT